MSRFLKNPAINFANKMLGGAPAKVYSALFVTAYEDKAPKQISEYFANHTNYYLNMGAGFNAIEGWLNADFAEHPGTIYIDATKKLQLPDNTFEAVFSEHMIEHIPYTAGNGLAKELFRILKPGGKIRINTPDLKFLIDLYSTEKTEIQKQYIDWSLNKFVKYAPINYDTFIINNFMHDWGHIFIYDAKTLIKTLELNGFVNIKQKSPNNTSYDIFKNVELHGTSIMPKEFNELETLVIEAEKPL